MNRVYKTESLNLNTEQWNYIIQNSDLNQLNNNGIPPLMFALEHKNNLNLNNEQWQYMLENSNLSLITNKEQLLELKKIQSELLTDEILSKMDIKGINKKVKI